MSNEAENEAEVGMEGYRKRVWTQFPLPPTGLDREVMAYGPSAARSVYHDSVNKFFIIPPLNVNA